MAASSDQRTDDTAILADISMLARRAGLALRDEQLRELVIPYRRTRELIAALRADLDLTEEPVTTFAPHH